MRKAFVFALLIIAAVAQDKKPIEVTAPQFTKDQKIEIRTGQKRIQALIIQKYQLEEQSRQLDAQIRAEEQKFQQAYQAMLKADGIDVKREVVCDGPLPAPSPCVGVPEDEIAVKPALKEEAKKSEEKKP